MRSVFYLLISRFSSLTGEETTADDTLLADLSHWLGLTSDLLRLGKKCSQAIKDNSIQQAKDILRATEGVGDDLNVDATYMSLFAEESNRGQDVTAEIETAAMAEDIALRLFYRHNLLSGLILGFDVPTGGSGLLSMMSDLLAIYPIQSKEVESGGNWILVSRLVDNTHQFIGDICENMFSNLLANAEGGVLLEQGKTKDSTELHEDHDIDEQSKLLRWRNQFLFSKHTFGDSSCTATVHVKRFVNSYERNNVLVALTKCFTVYIRSAWTLFESPEKRTQSIEPIAVLLSWYGRWNKWTDEIIRCVFEQLKETFCPTKPTAHRLSKQATADILVGAMKKVC